MRRNEGLNLDFNGIAHWARNYTYASGPFETPDNVARVERSTQKELRDFQFKLTVYKLEEIIHQTKPRIYIHLAIDGVAPLAKMSQQGQRRRRVLAGEAEVVSAYEDRNAITPGTEFMFELDAYIRRWFTDNQNQPWMPPIVVFSGHTVPGEGEHKILEAMRNPPEILRGAMERTSGDHVVYGLDADLYMLMLLSPLTARGKSILLMREDVEDVASIHALARYITDRFPNWSHEDAIKTFVVALFLVGNDFLPHGKMFHDMAASINILLDSLSEPLVKNNRIIRPVLAAWLTRVAEHEWSALVHAHGTQHGGGTRAPISHPDSILDAALAPDSEGRARTEEEQRRTYRDLWNAKLTGYAPNTVEQRQQLQVCTEAYLAGLDWTLGYYLGQPVSQSYLYPSYYAPMVADLAETARAGNYAQPAPLPAPVIPDSQARIFRQLVAVMPKTSANLLPVPLRPLLVDPDSPVADMMPDRVVVDLDGTNEEWQGIVLAPMIEWLRMRTSVDDVLLANPTLLNDRKYHQGTVWTMHKRTSRTEEVPRQPMGISQSRSQNLKRLSAAFAHAS